MKLNSIVLDLKKSKLDEIRMVDQSWAKRLEPYSSKFFNKLIHIVKYPDRGVIIGFLPSDGFGPERVTMWDGKNLIGSVALDKNANGTISLNTPMIKMEYRRKQLGILFYQYVLDELMKPILSHGQQTPGSAMIWSQLKRNPEYNVEGVSSDGKRVPVIADGMRLFSQDVTVYDDDNLAYLICEPKGIRIKRFW